MKNMSKCNLNQLPCISKVPLSQTKFLTVKNEKKAEQINQICINMGL